MSTTLRTSTGSVITLDVEGIEEVQRELNDMADSIRTQTALDMMTDIGEHVKYWMQQKILEQKLYKSGDLFMSIFATVMTRGEGDDQDVSVYVGPNTEKIPYAMIQNYGGVVPAHWVFPKGVINGGSNVLHWKDDKGNHFFSKGHQVGIKHPIIIPARPYIEPAYEDHAEEILQLMQDWIYAGIAESASGW